MTANCIVYNLLEHMDKFAGEIILLKGGKKEMKKKALSTFLSVAMVASMLVGCGGGSEEAAAPAAEAPAAAEEAPAAEEAAPAEDAVDAAVDEAAAATSGGGKVGVAMPTQSSESWI